MVKPYLPAPATSSHFKDPYLDLDVGNEDVGAQCAVDDVPEVGENKRMVCTIVCRLQGQRSLICRRS